MTAPTAARASSEASSSGVTHGNVGRGALWSGLSNVVMRIANILVTVVLARLLSPSEFGVFALALAVYVVITSLAELGLAAAVARSPEEPTEIAPTVTTVSLAVSGVLALCMAWQAAPLARLVGSVEATDSLRILSISVFLTGLFAVPGAQLARDFRQRRLFAATVAGFVPANLLLVVLAIGGQGAEAFAWSRVLGQVVTGLVMVAAVRVYRPGLRREMVVPLLLFGLPLSAANLVNWALLNADYVILGRFLSDGDVGTYMIAFTVASWSTAVLGSALNAVVVPAFARLGPDSSAVATATTTGLRIVALVALPIGVTTMVLADPLVDSLFGDQWASAAPVLQVLSAYGVLYAFSLLLVNVLVSQGRTASLLSVQLVWIVLLVPTMVAAVPYGLVGVAWVHVVVMGSVTLPGYVLVLRDVLPGPRRVLRTLARPLLAALVAGGAGLITSRALDAYGAGSWSVFLAGGAGAVLAYLLLAGRELLAFLPGRSS